MVCVNENVRQNPEGEGEREGDDLMEKTSKTEADKTEKRQHGRRFSCGLTASGWVLGSLAKLSSIHKNDM